jgi:superfamily II DNA helicase RecQ
MLDNVRICQHSEYANKVGIVYCHSQQNCEQKTGKLRTRGTRAQDFHAEHQAVDKALFEKVWQALKFKVFIGKITFSKGIVKLDLWFVIHHNIPKILNGYYWGTGHDGGTGFQVGFLVRRHCALALMLFMEAGAKE